MEWLALEFVVFHMRERDKEEIFNNLPTDNPLEWAAMCQQAVDRRGMAWTAFFNGRPTACLGAFEQFPGNWQIFSFGSEQFQRVVTAFLPCYRKLVTHARELGCHRMECKSLADYTEAHKFLELMEFRRECTLHQYGRRRQDYILFYRLMI